MAQQNVSTDLNWGMAALVGVLLTPGVIWIANAKSLGSQLARMALVAGLVTGAVALEATIDDSVKEIAA